MSATNIHPDASADELAPRVQTWPALRDVVTPNIVGRVTMWIAIGAGVVRLIGNLQGFFLVDDFAFIARAASTPLLSREGLLDLYMGHFMPAGFALNWVVVHIAPFNYLLPALLMAVGWLVCVVLMRVLLLDWLGPRPLVIGLLAMYAVSPLPLQATAWWAAALNALPLHIALLTALIALRRRHRAGSTLARLAWSGLILASCLVALSFFEKALLLPLMLAGVAVAWSPETRMTRAIRDAWTRTPGLWLALGAVCAAYIVVYLRMDQALVQPGTSPALASIADRAGLAVIGNGIPGAVGGPLAYTDLDGVFADRIVDPPAWLQWSALVALAALIVLAVAGSTQSRRLMAVLGIYGGAIAVVVSGGRSLFVSEVALSPRYFADAAVPLTLAAAATAVAWLDRDTSRMASSRGGSRAAWIVGGSIAAVIALSLASTTAFFSGLRHQPSADATLRSLADLSALPADVTLLDQPIADTILTPLASPYDVSSRFYALRTPTFADQAPRLDVWTSGGVLAPGRIVGPRIGRPGICAWTADPTTTITLPDPVLNFVHTVELRVESPVATQADVTIGQGETVTWQFPAGESVQYRRQVGGGDTVTVTSSAPMCVQSIAVGAAVPVEDAS